MQALEIFQPSANFLCLDRNQEITSLLRCREFIIEMLSLVENNKTWNFFDCSSDFWS